jgi:penicillin-binding protein 2
MHFPAADLLLDSRRVYQNGALAGHIIGYVGARQAREEDDQQYHYYLPDVEGKQGIEKTYNKWLAGTAGGRLVRVDVSGYKHDDASIRPPVPGGDLRLSLEVRRQKAAEEAVADTCGAVVVINPANGDIIAMAGSPGFNPNLFCPSISLENWQSISADVRKPLFNRAVSGLYAPGSTFKPLVALAALVQGKARADTTYPCEGVYELGDQFFSCHMGDAHGTIDLAKALEVSCNIYFYQLGLHCGYDVIYHMASAAGFGEKTGLDLDGEASGFLPSKAWKRQAQGAAWCDGDTCNIVVGQGALLVTPLQMAVFTAAVANGGRLFRPRLVTGKRQYNQAEFKELPPVLERELHWPAASLAVVKEGMRRVINESSGTGHLAALPDVVMAGKTGTAEFGKKGSGQQRGWMILFAPYENPRYAVAMVVDEGVSGGLSVAPRLRKMMESFFLMEMKEAS